MTANQEALKRLSDWLNHQDQMGFDRWYEQSKLGIALSADQSQKADEYRKTLMQIQALNELMKRDELS